MKPNTHRGPATRAYWFMQIGTHGLIDKVFPMLEAGFLKASDITVLIALASFGTPFGFKLKTTCDRIAETIGMHPVSVKKAMGRLRAASIVVYKKDQCGSGYYVIEPSIVKFNGSQNHYAAAAEAMGEPVML